MRRRFFVERFDGSAGALRGEAAHHLGRVLRAQAGQLYELSDGQTVWLSRVERVAQDVVEFSLVEPVAAREARLRITLLLSIVKFDRFEWCLEKATELGVDEILPLSASRSERALVAAARKRAKRWEKILLESAQQARRLRPPILKDAVAPAKAFARFGTLGTLRIFLSERPESPPVRDVLEGKTETAICLAIGPEGGWTGEESAAARADGFAEASLGGNILRTETAVIAALAVVNSMLGE